MIYNCFNSEGPSNGNAHLMPPRYQYERPPSSASTSMSSNSNANASAKGSKYSSLAFRQQGAEMMSRIKADMIASRRLFSEKTEKSIISQEDEQDIIQRSGAPSPDTRPQTAIPTPRKRTADEEQNEPELPSYAASVEASRISLSPEKFVFPNRGNISSQQIASNQVMSAFTFPVVIPEQQEALHDALQDDHASDRVRSPNPTFLAPPSIAFNNVRSNSDLNRFVSSSTTATNATGTTLTGGSFVKHAGPPQMVHIAPTDLPQLPERFGRMVYDNERKRWVRERATEAQSAAPNTDATFPETEAESEDPFKDFESLRDEDSRQQNITHANLEASNISGISQDFISEHMEETHMEDDMDTDTDSDGDEDGAQFSTFSFTGPAAGIVRVITGEEDDMDEEDETTDTDGEPDSQSQLEEVQYESDGDNTERGNNLANHIASLASMSIQDSPDRQPTANESHIVGFSDLGSAMQTPSAQDKRVVQPPRSALKSTSVTPAGRPGHGRSVSFSDGRKDGKMIDLESADRRNATATASFLPSARTNRIANMLDNLEEPSE